MEPDGPPEGCKRGCSVLIVVSALGGTLVAALSTHGFTESPSNIAVAMAVFTFCPSFCTSLCFSCFMPTIEYMDPERGYERFSGVVACITSLYCLLGFALFAMYPYSAGTDQDG
jgi:hypothetical protein